MTQPEKVKILLAAMKTKGCIDPCLEELIKEALLEGQLKIDQMETETRKAMDTYSYFTVEHVKEGFAIWNCGGYQVSRKMGHALVAAGYDLRELKVLRTFQEKNGRHTQCLVYQGCFLCECDIFDDRHEIFRIYQIVSLIGRKNQCKAKCQCLLTLADGKCITVLSEEDAAKFKHLMEAAYSMAAREDNVSTGYKVS